MIYLFKDSALASMECFVDRATLFAFDLDGTLAPIVPDPGDIGIPEAVRKELAILNKSMNVAVITGRSCDDARSHLGISPRYLIGNHGAEGLAEWRMREKEFSRTADSWQDQLTLLLPFNDRHGISIENKGTTLSIHYRYADNIEVAHASILRAIHKLVPRPRRVSGKCIENLIPENAPDKGIALKILMRQAACPKGFFAGDDETDEDVFRLDDENIFTVQIGGKSGSRAKFYLKDQHEITRLLREINKIAKRIKR